MKISHFNGRIVSGPEEEPHGKGRGDKTGQVGGQSGGNGVAGLVNAGGAEFK